MAEHPANIEAKELALATGVSGDYYMASVDAWVAVAVNPDTKGCIILGWYDGELKRQSPEWALQFSMDLWRQLIPVPPGFSVPPEPTDD